MPTARADTIDAWIRDTRMLQLHRVHHKCYPLLRKKLLAMKVDTDDLRAIERYAVERTERWMFGSWEQLLSNWNALVQHARGAHKNAP